MGAVVIHGENSEVEVHLWRKNHQDVSRPWIAQFMFGAYHPRHLFQIQTGIRLETNRNDVASPLECCDTGIDHRGIRREHAAKIGSYARITTAKRIRLSALGNINGSA